MEISVRNILIGTAVVFFTGATVSYYITRTYTPEKIVTKTEVVEKVVIKEVESKKVAKKVKVDRTTTTVKNKDGSEVITVVDKTVSDTQIDSKKESSQTSDKKEKAEVSTSSAKDWRLGLKADVDARVFEASAGRRVLWGVWAEASYNTKVKKPLLGLSVEF